jgi:hypothetical protein
MPKRTNVERPGDAGFIEGMAMTARTVSALFLVLAISVAGSCTRVKTTDVQSDQLRDQIVSGELIQTGNRVTITTADGANHELTVTEITEDKVLGENTIVRENSVDESTLEVVPVTETEDIEIPIADIVSIDTHELTPVGTAGAVVGAAAGIGAFFYVFYFLLPAVIVGAMVGM